MEIQDNRKDKKGKKKRKTRREIVYYKPEEGQMFAKILSNNGHNFTLKCTDEQIRIGRVCNSMRRGSRLFQNMFVCISLREFGDTKFCDILGIASPSGEVQEVFHKMSAKESNLDVIFETNEIEVYNEETGQDEVINWEIDW